MEQDCQTVKSIFDSLMPGGTNKGCLLFWPPNLFAFTSKILRTNAAYELVASPPENERWPPNIETIKEIISPFKPELYAAKILEEEKYKNCKEPWNLLVRECGCLWSETLQKISVKNDLPKELQEIENAKDSLQALQIQRLAGTDESLRQKIREMDWRTPLAENDHLTVLCFLRCFWLSFTEWATKEKNIRLLRCDSKVPPEDRKEAWLALQSLLSLHAIADEACWGWGLSSTGKGEDREAKKYACELLHKQGTLSTINPDICRVLPKRHNPTVGITLRSLSSNIGFQTSAVDVDVNWLHSGRSPLDDKIRAKAAHSFNILLLPWPLRVQAQDFRPHSFSAENPPLSENYSFFVYDPGETEEKTKKRYERNGKNFVTLEERIEKNLPLVLDKAMDEVGADNIDIVIFPEGALDEKQLKIVEARLAEKKVSMYIAGVRDGKVKKDQDGNPVPNAEPFRFERNAIYFKTLELQQDGAWKYPQNGSNAGDNLRRFRQSKHHRWKLNRSQILKYNLGMSLDPSKDWMEGIKINRRKVSFINIGDELTLCPLICEDLARQDPIPSVIRTVGPSLVVTILMDGPQTMDRWAARYASILADDPGSTVLTLTSYGMVRRSNQTARIASESIALFYDGQSEPKEIKFDKNSAAVLLSLCIEDKLESTLDGRKEKKKTRAIRFGGLKSVRLTPQQLKELFDPQERKSDDQPPESVSE